MLNYLSRQNYACIEEPGPSHARTSPCRSWGRSPSSSTFHWSIFEKSGSSQFSHWSYPAWFDSGLSGFCPHYRI